MLGPKALRISNALFVLLSIIVNSSAFVGVTSSRFRTHQHLTQTNMATNDTQENTNLGNSKPFCIVVDAEIHPDRMDEFLRVMEEDAAGSRAEPGCLRFDVVQNQEQKNKFMFYEVYQNAEAVEFHKKQPHFKLWTDFKASGGVIQSVSYKCDGVFMS